MKERLASPPRGYSPQALLAVLWPLLVAIVLLLALGFLTLRLTNAARAYVGGEGLWSKSQKEAVMHLVRYAGSQQEADYQGYLKALAVPLGDRIARLELEKASPDLALATAGFLQGQNHPDDIPGMIALFRYFRHYPLFDKAIRQWAEADLQIEQLQSVAGELHALLRAAPALRPPAARLQALTQDIYRLNEALWPIEDAFSDAINETSRELSRVLYTAMTVLSVLLLGFGVALSHRILVRTQRAEHELRIINQRFELATSGANDGIWDWNLVTREMYCSPRFRELLGYRSEAEFQQAYVLSSHLHPDDAVPVLGNLRNHLANRSTAFNMELRLRCRDGSYRWFHARGRGAWHASGRPLRFSGAITDITLRKLAEQEQREMLELQRKTAEELDLALHGAEVALWAYTPATGKVIHMRRWETLLGRKTMPATLDEWQKLVHPDDRAQRPLALQKYLDDETAYRESEFRLRHAAGHWVWVRSRGRTITRDENGVPLHYAGVVMDISPQMAARRLEHEQHRFLQTMIEGVDTGVMVAGEQFITYINTSFRLMLGYTPDDPVVGMAVDDMIAPDDRALAQQRRRKALAGRPVPAGLLRMKKKDGSLVQLALNLSFTLWKGAPHFITTATMASEHEALAVRIHAARNRFERTLLSELEAQQADIARELHDSLGSVLAGISLMLGGARGLAAGDPELSRHLDHTQEQVKSAAETTRALARGLMPVGSHPGAFLRAMEQLTSDLSLAKSVWGTFEANGDFEHVPPETGVHLYRIAQEAISNAVRHGHATRIDVQLDMEGESLLMSIEDNGTGFERSDVRHDHPGLGLQSMAARAKAIHGHLSFARAASGGCAVVIAWPQHPADFTGESLPPDLSAFGES
ncbi:PAS domain-containing protein [Variovorax terrae]|uniref:histidine kinase n=1 Tax=Variovorax terrae TaxID=2923278 RepID=A0A9X2AQR9_9BURK|nr:PAS domain-containing protein [Variovorax terrae]MCJ0763491.1 PAS domain-containing protein [Variovorax terrae]